jgi:transposase
MAYRSTLNRLRCWAHLQRKLCGVAQSTDQQAARSGQAMLDLFECLIKGVFEARDKLKAMPAGLQDDPPTLPVLIHARQVEELQALCEKYRDAKHEALRAIAREFLNDWQAIMRVLSDPLLPLTNNAAERQLRHWVIARRISFGTRSLVGSNSLALLASVIDTCRARQTSVTDLLARAIHAARLGLPAPALPPIPAHLLARHGALVGM